MRYKYSQNLTEASEMTFAENEYQGIEQNGTMKRIPTTKVKQGVHNATHDHVDFATNPVADTNTVGRLLWDDDAKTLSIVRDNTGGTKVSVEIGDEIQVRVKNTTGATILNGQPVYTTSALGNTPLIALADGDDPTKNRVTGLMTADIANNGVSYLTTVGLVRNVPIANIIDPADVSWTVGTYLYLSTVTGKLTKNRPSVGTAVRVGIITDISGSNCTILVYLRDDYAKIFDDIDNAISAIKGTGYTEGSLKTHEDRLDTLEGTGEGSVAKAIDDALEPIDARVDSTELTLVRHDQDLASVKQTLQQGNGATLYFEDIGIVPLDARATGRANLTVDGLTATNLNVNAGFETNNLTGWSVVSGMGAFPVTFSQGVASFTVNAQYARLENISVVTGRTYIALARFKSDSNQVVIWNGAGLSSAHSGSGLFEIVALKFTAVGTNFRWLMDLRASGWTEIQLDWTMLIDITATPTASLSASDCAKIFSSYFSGTKSIQLPARVRSVSEDETETSTLYIADDSELRSIQTVYDTVSVVNGEHMLTKKISTPVSVASGVAVNTTNYPTAKTGGKFAVELTAGGTQIGVIGTDSTSGAGMLRYELATPVITELLTSGILQAKPKGTVYFEPYYEGAHQTDASSQITLPYEGTIDKITGYDENLEPYEIPSTGYTLVGTLLTITGALENEVFYVEMQRSEPLAPEMSVNVLNNEQVIADTANGKFYKLVPTITNGVLVNQTPVEVV